MHAARADLMEADLRRWERRRRWEERFPLAVMFIIMIAAGLASVALIVHFGATSR